MPAGRREKPTLAILVRHGSTPTTGEVLPGRARGLHLSDKGVEQAKDVAARMAELRECPVAVYASPLERAVETAKPIAEACATTVVVEPDLIECDFGEWTGEKLSLLRKKPAWVSVAQRPSCFRFPGGESFPEMQHRVWTTLDKLMSRHEGETFVAVSHADCIKALVAQAAGIPLDLFQRVVVSPCSVSIIARGRQSIHILCVNSTSSLQEIVLS
jgi:probable phosphomutase (TIGR03848 family)